ncbi:P-type DNA transfer ATPase VirB11 [Erwinia amylovora]|uniref:P-type DNA transfer ATPase VirB11 n=1 Tax=Erwinia amylovora TaxID=552 RepID=UPI00200A3FAA|nr:P-type DNA transfer ATPase VirB11 [Erwinia amylovora]MCK8373825.1 P-type DNA transfer ATPase VirB11 [Erwinia amylovora]
MHSSQNDLQTNDDSHAIQEYIQMLQPYFDIDGVNEIVINKPGEIITETRNGWEYHEDKNMNLDACLDMAKLTANYSDQRISEQEPLLSATLPLGERIQIVQPPATLPGRVSMTIRKPSNVIMTLQDWRNQGAFDDVIGEVLELRPLEKELLALHKARDYESFLDMAVKNRLNVVLSGATGSGKTTFMRSLMQLIPQDERLISIENVNEARLYETHPNVVPLFYSANNQGKSNVTQQLLLESALRMRPDRVFCAELIKGDEAFYYLRNVNSGHPGSMTTMHSESADLAIEQLGLFIKESQSGQTLAREDIRKLLFMCIDVVVQIKRHNGRRYISEIKYDPQYKRQLLAA